MSDQYIEQDLEDLTVRHNNLLRHLGLEERKPAFEVIKAKLDRDFVVSCPCGRSVGHGDAKEHYDRGHFDYFADVKVGRAVMD